MKRVIKSNSKLVTFVKNEVAAFYRDKLEGVVQGYEKPRSTLYKSLIAMFILRTYNQCYWYNPYDCTYHYYDMYSASDLRHLINLEELNELLKNYWLGLGNATQDKLILNQNRDLGKYTPYVLNYDLDCIESVLRELYFYTTFTDTKGRFCNDIQ